MQRRRFAVALALAAAFVAAGASAQTWPDKPVRILVPAPAGSSLDVLARYELDYMGVDFGAPLATSTRTHMGTSISRTDIFHGITAGVSKPF